MHYGQIVEYTVRKKGLSIAELARLVNVNRRSVYNWFNQEKLKVETIYRIGIAIKHDFSIEFPDIFAKGDFANSKINGEGGVDDSKDCDTLADHLWKERYISLLENYNTFLSRYPQLKARNSDATD